MNTMLKKQFEGQQNEREILRDTYTKNNEIISKLKNMLLDKNSDKKIVKDSIDLMYKNQRKTINNLMRDQMVASMKDKTEVLTSGMKKDIGNDDKTEVLTSDMKDEDYKKKVIDYDDEIIEVEDKTEVLTSGMKKDIGNDDKTDVLTSDMKERPTVEVLNTEAVRKEVFKDARIVFDGKYKLFYNEDRYVYEYDIDENMLRHNIDSESIYDFNIITMLKKFDELNNTKLYERYMVNKIPVHYDLVESKHNKIKKSILKRLITLTEGQQEEKEFKNSTVRRIKKKNARVIAATIGLAAMAFFGAMGLGKARNKSTEASTTAVAVEEYAGSSDALVDDTEVTTTEATTYEEVKEEVFIEDDVVVDDYETDTVDIVEEDAVEEVVKTETRVGDIIQFTDDVDLYYASTDENPRGNTSYIQEKKFKVGLISVVYKGNVVAYVDNSDISLEELKEECKKKYGDDIEVSINADSLNNSDEVVTQYLGWIDEEQYQECGKVLVK